MKAAFQARPALIALAMAALVTGCSQQPPARPRGATTPVAASSAPPVSAPGSPAMDPAMQMDEPGTAMPTVAATAEVEGVFGSGKPVTVTLHVTDGASGKALGPNDFEIEHTKTIHVLSVDPSLTDYSHAHPRPAGSPGIWSYAFVPRYNRAYHAWLDVKPVGGSQQYVMLTLNGQTSAAPVEKTLSRSAAVGAITAQLTFDAPLVQGQAASGHVRVFRDGKPFTALQPVMAAYAHIVGIAQDWQTIAHVHPMGAEPARDSDRGGPDIAFHLEPKRAGFLKLFAQIRVDGRDVYLPFGVLVAPSLKPSGAQQ